MKKKTRLWGRIAVTFAISFFIFTNVAEASGGEDYITIRVQASDENEGLKYAIDSNDEAAFSDRNEFTIPAGTSHTIYVKDAAGNITSQVYDPAGNTGSTSMTGNTGDTQQINIDLELGSGKKEDYSNYEYLTDEPVDKGTGTVTGKTTTDGSDTAEKVFYTIKSDTGEVFYMVIDQSQSADNVYLLNPVTLGDLKALAADDSAAVQEENAQEGNLLEALRGNSEEEIFDVQTSSDEKKTNTFSNNLIFLVILAVGGGAYYYLKVYKNKKDEMMDTMDAMDIEEFEAEEEKGEEVEFDVDDEEKERYLNELIEEDDEEEMLYDKDPEHYYEEHISSEEGALHEKEPQEEMEEEFNFADEDEEEEEDE